MNLFLFIPLLMAYLAIAVATSDKGWRIQVKAVKADREWIREQIAAATRAGDGKRRRALLVQEGFIRPSVLLAWAYGIFWPLTFVFAGLTWLSNSGHRLRQRAIDKAALGRRQTEEYRQDFLDRMAFWTAQCDNAEDFVAREIAQENVRFLLDTAPAAPPKPPRAGSGVSRSETDGEKLARLRKAAILEADVKRAARTHGLAVNTPSPTEAREIPQILRAPIEIDEQLFDCDTCRYCWATKPATKFTRKGTCDDCEHGLWA